MSIGSERKAFKAGKEARPDFCTDEHLESLDDIRESGVCNMYGAVPFLREDFPELSWEDGSAILGYWMKSFGNPNR